MKLLALDTASALCSAALLLDGQLITREYATAREHATRLLPMIDELLGETGVELAALDAIAFGRGPGSFTGLRVAASVAHGLAFGADLPLIPVSDLRALAVQAMERAGCAVGPVGIACCMDARMGEVYAAAYEVAAGQALPGEAAEHVIRPGDFRPGGELTLLIGRGFDAYPAELAALRGSVIRTFGDAEPRARDIGRLAAADWVAGVRTAENAALPVYLRDDVARPAPSS